MRSAGFKNVWAAMRPSHKIALAAALVLVIGVGVNAKYQGAPTATPNQFVSISIAKSYNTLAELERDADIVALVSVAGEPIPSMRFGNIPSVDVQLRIERVFAGTAQIGDDITLAQMGDLSGKIKVTEPIPPLLQNGKRYVIYLNRQFPDQPQLVITGSVGVFEAVSDTEFRRLGDASPDLPMSVSLDQF